MIKNVMRSFRKLLLFLTFPIVVTIIFLCITIPDSVDVMKSVNLAYRIYNEGLENVNFYYEEVKISSPTADDRNILLHKGLAYVNYPNLIEFEIKDSLPEIHYSNSTFKAYPMLSLHCINITVDKEHIDDISYYEYKYSINWKACSIIFIIYLASIAIPFVIGACIVTYEEHKNNMQENENNDTKQEDEEKEEADEDEEQEDTEESEEETQTVKESE